MVENVYRGVLLTWLNGFDWQQSLVYLSLGRGTHPRAKERDGDLARNFISCE